MTNTEILNYFTFLAKQAGLPDDGLDDHLDNCITLGLSDFWNARPWSFRSEPYSLDITEEAEQYKLPANFAGVRTVREHDSLEGNDLGYKIKEEFDHIVAHPTQYPSTYPQIYTIYFDNSQAASQRYYIKLFPVPESGHTMLIDMLTDTPSNVSAVPTKGLSALLASIAKFIPKIGTVERRAAMIDARQEIVELEREDSPFMGKLYKVFDDTDTQLKVTKPWI